MNLTERSHLTVHVCKVYGLGVAWDTWPVCSDDIKTRWTSVHLKVYVLFILISFVFPVWFKKPYTS